MTKINSVKNSNPLSETPLGDPQQCVLPFVGYNIFGDTFHEWLQQVWTLILKGGIYFKAEEKWDEAFKENFIPEHAIHDLLGVEV